MTTAADGPSWSDIATWYDGLLRAGSGPHETATACLLGLVPQPTGAEVLDLACGQASPHGRWPAPAPGGSWGSMRRPP
jgi:hypothetical protein